METTLSQLFFNKIVCVNRDEVQQRVEQGQLKTTQCKVVNPSSLWLGHTTNQDRSTTMTIFASHLARTQEAG